MLDRLEQEIQQLNRQVEEEVKQRPSAMKLMSHPGVGPVTALALVLTLGPAERFHSPKQVGQLLRADSQRALQRRAPAAGAHYQAGQFVFALPAGGGGPVGCTVRF